MKAPEQAQAAVEGPLNEKLSAVDNSRSWRPSAPTTLLLTALAGLLLWFGAAAFLVLFAGVLSAVFLRSLAEELVSRTPLSRAFALATVTLALLAVAAGFGALAAPEVAKQVDELGERIPEVVDAASNALGGYRWGVEFIEQASTQLQESSAALAGQALKAFQGVIGGVVSLFFVPLFGVYLAAESERYQQGVAALFPKDLSPMVLDVLTEMGYTLRWWLVGQAVSMTVLGIVSYIGFRLFDIPLALLLALVTALLTFIPTVGPVLAAIPPLLLAISQGPWTLLYVAVFLLALQVSEGSFLTPLVQRQAVDMPPALLLGIQIVASATLGFMGLVLAAPLTVAGMTLVRKVYIEGVLGKGRGSQLAATSTPVIRPAAAADRIPSSPDSRALA